ncbi:ATP-binding protein [Streptomyces sp. NPDC001156]
MARRLTLPLLHRWGVNGDCAARVELVVSELVTNAVCHARPDVRITWKVVSRDGRPAVRVEVVDGGPADGALSPCPVRGADEGGRGITVITVLASRRGTLRGEGGTTVWWAEVGAW